MAFRRVSKSLLVSIFTVGLKYEKKNEGEKNANLESVELTLCRGKANDFLTTRVFHKFMFFSSFHSEFCPHPPSALFYFPLEFILNLLHLLREGMLSRA